MTLVIAAALAAGFVGACYIVPSRIRELPRDEPVHIKARAASLLVYTCLCYGIMSYILTSTELVVREASATTLPSWLGFPSDGLFRRVLSAIGLTFCLFFGPVVADTLLYIVSRNEEEKSVVLLSRFQLIHHWTVAFRNLVVAPITEEVVFRGCILPLLFWEGYTVTQAILIAPVFFGFAHLHHLWRLVKEGYPLKTAVLNSVVQCFYTTLFGMYSGFLFVRTGSLLGVMVVHSFCNAMGFPTMEWTEAHHPLYKLRNLVNVCFLIGLVVFFVFLLPATEPRQFGSLYPAYGIGHGSTSPPPSYVMT